MGFTIPNEADAFHANQAEPDKVDIDILAAGYAWTGVVSGCAVTPNVLLTLDVAAGTVMVAGVLASVTAGTVVIGTANATNPRIDLITVSNAGTKAVTAGTAAAQPVMPAIPADSVVLAAVYVPALDLTIGATQITDKRVMLGALNLGRAMTMDPRYCTANGNIVGANRAVYVRVTEGHGPVLASKLAITVGVSNGNISLAHYSNTGLGRAARPLTRLQTTGAVACPAAGYNEVALGAASLVMPGDWLALSADGTTATFARVIGTSLQGNHGLSHWEATAHPCPATATPVDHSVASPSPYIEAIV